jgi:hypothetical protein
MYQIKADTIKNVMYVLLKGFLNETNVKETVSQIRRAADSLRPGFVIVNDIAEFFPTSPKVADEISKVQAYVSQKGCKKTIRIVGNVLSKHQVKKCHETVHAGYEVIEVSTLEEAERYL